ncbi:hypothetical protein ABBQ32_002014 [Trebouxia sp. C0010 RCD-2024]
MADKLVFIASQAAIENQQDLMDLGGRRRADTAAAAAARVVRRMMTSTRTILSDLPCRACSVCSWCLLACRVGAHQSLTWVHIT